jgi:hypothetical protein
MKIIDEKISAKTKNFSYALFIYMERIKTDFDKKFFILIL